MSLAEELEDLDAVQGAYPLQKRVRARTVSIKRLSKRNLDAGRALANRLLDGLDATRPKTRAECVQGANALRPCPFVSCVHHLFLDVNPRSGAIKINFPDLEVHELAETCALDVADRGGVTLDEVGAAMNLVRERIRQLETKGIAQLKTMRALAALVDCED